MAKNALRLQAGSVSNSITVDSRVHRYAATKLESNMTVFNKLSRSIKYVYFIGNVTHNSVALPINFGRWVGTNLEITVSVEK